MQGGSQRGREEAEEARGSLERSYPPTAVGHPRSELGTVSVELALSPKNLARGAKVLISLPSWKLRLQWDLPFTLAGRGHRDSRADFSLSLCCLHVIHSHLSQSPSDLGWDHSTEPIVSQRVYIDWP